MKQPRRENDFDLGPCCICGGSNNARNIFMLPKRSPYRHGWGCFQCGLPAEGASAVVCNRCMDRFRDKVADKLRYFCRPDGDGSYSKGRAPIAELAAAPAFEHDMSKHPGEANGST